ncbi:oxygenase MpaB family protein, partial [Nocardia sp. NPDC003345]
MSTYYPELARRVRGQRELLPGLYGDFDFGKRPYRLATDPDDESSLPKWVAKRDAILADERLTELISTATLLGDTVADPFAALSARHSVTELVTMVRRACREGVEAVPSAPPELKSFIAAMEATPDWVDMDLVRAGAAQARIPAALLAPFVTRGAFIATFTNTYAALPMALTGALSGRRAARRVNETANFFAVTTLPGALDRHGPGFEAAAMVRLMHSMVRYNALTRSDRWDADIYGVPVPQVDQMPAGMIDLYLLSVRVRRQGRTEFTDGERAQVEFSRYRCFLLGLPEELLPTTPEGIIRAFHARAALLRDGFDDATCGELIRSTMAAYLRPGRSRFDRIADAVERSYSKGGFILAFCRGDL